MTIDPFKAPLKAGANYVQTDNGVMKVVAQTYSGCDTCRKEGVVYARLFAAAPDLAESLRALLELHIAHHNHPYHTAARAALAKATTGGVEVRIEPRRAG